VASTLLNPDEVAIVIAKYCELYPNAKIHKCDFMMYLLELRRIILQTPKPEIKPEVKPTPTPILKSQNYKKKK